MYKKILGLFLLLPAISFAVISDSSISQLEGLEFSCSTAEVGQDSLDDFYNMIGIQDGDGPQNGTIVIEEITSDHLFIKSSYSLSGFTVSNSYKITDAKEFQVLNRLQIYEENDLPLDDFEAYLDGDVSIATKIQFKSSMFSDEISEIWIRKGIVNAANPFGSKAFKCTVE